MEATEGNNEERKLTETRFSISIGSNILESSKSMSSREQSPYGSGGKTNSQLIANTQAQRNKNPGASSKTRKSSSQNRTVKTTDLTDDGYGWRKYGQKEINNNLHPKSYYRCTHHMEKKCEAKKWVQKESDDPPVYKTTYLGNHTCQSPLKLPQTLLPYTCTSSSSSSMSKPILLCFNSPTSNHSSDIIPKDQHHVSSPMGSATLPSLPPADSKLFSDDPTSIIRQGPDEIETSLPPMGSPSSNFGSYDFNRMVEELLDLDTNMEQ